MNIAKVKQHFSHKGKEYKPGENFQGEDHEIQTLTGQGMLEHPAGSQTIGQQHGPGGQPQGQGQGSQAQSQGAPPYPGTDPPKQQTAPHDPPKQGR